MSSRRSATGLDVVDAARRRRGSPRRRGGGRAASSTSGRRCAASVSAVAETIGTVVPNASSVRATASSWRKVTTGLPSAIASIANRPYQPAFELVDDDVGAPRSGLRASSWWRPSTISRSTGSSRAGGDHVLGALAAAARGGVDDDGALAGRWAGAARTRAGRCPAGRPPRPAPSGSRRRSRRSGRRPSAPRPARRAACRGCRSRGSASPSACRVARKSGNCRDFGTSVSPK